MKKSMNLFALAVVGGTVGSLLASSPAQAVGVNFGGAFYDVSVVEMSYDTATNAFQLPPLGQMPWWGSQANADDFAGQVFGNLGEGSFAGYGPLFAYDFDSSLSQVVGSLQDLSAPGSLIDGTPAGSATVKYAIASAPAPAPLPLFGAAAAFGCARQLRRRIIGR